METRLFGKNATLWTVALPRAISLVLPDTIRFSPCKPPSFSPQ
jgi:hypothetical protein